MLSTSLNLVKLLRKAFLDSVVQTFHKYPTYTVFISLDKTSKETEDVGPGAAVF